MNPIYGESLYHYGIKGQKWGVKRYQNADRTWTDEGKIRYGRKGTLAKKRAEEKSIKSINKEKKVGKAGLTVVPLVDPSKAIDTISSNKSDPHKKKGNHGELAMRGVQAAVVAKNIADYARSAQYISAVTGMPVANVLGDVVGLTPIPAAATALMAGNLAVRVGKAVKSHYDTKKYNAERESNPIDKETGFHKKSIKMDESEDLKRVNPEVNNFNSNTKSNCMLCTTAYELRRRGYDVRAEKAGIGYDDSDIKKWFPGAKLKSIDMGEHNKIGKTIAAVAGLNTGYAKDVIESMANSQPNGARGNLIVRWGSGGAHSMAYEIKNNKLVILDSQINKIYDNPEKILRNCTNVQYARLDNIEFNKKSIKECCI
jgi:hypothetical protein